MSTVPGWPSDEGLDATRVLFNYAASVLNGLPRRKTDPGVRQAERLMGHAAVRLQWADAGYRLSVSAQDPEAAADYERCLGPEAGEIVAAGASLALRESATVVDLAAAAVWRWEHPSAHGDAARQKDLQQIHPDKLNEQALRQWVEGAQNDGGLSVMRIRRDRLTHRAPVRGVSGRATGRIVVGPSTEPLPLAEPLPLPPVKLDGVPVDEIARDAISLASRWYLDLIRRLRGLSAAEFE